MSHMTLRDRVSKYLSELRDAVSQYGRSGSRLTIGFRLLFTIVPGLIFLGSYLANDRMVQPWMVIAVAIAAVFVVGSFTIARVQVYFTSFGMWLVIAELTAASGISAMALVENRTGKGTSAPVAAAAIDEINKAISEEQIDAGGVIDASELQDYVTEIANDCDSTGRYVPHIQGTATHLFSSGSYGVAIPIRGSEANHKNDFDVGRYVALVQMDEPKLGFPEGLSCVVVVRPKSKLDTVGKEIERLRALIVPIGGADHARMTRIARCKRHTINGSARALWHDKSADASDNCRAPMAAKFRNGDPTVCFSCASYGWCEM